MMSGKLFGVNTIFSDHMVLQRDSIVSIWGTGADGESVTVHCRGLSAEAAVRDGCWKIELPPFGVRGPYELTVESGGEQIKFRDVLFGDVWLAGGQSNMEWNLAVSENGEQEAAFACIPKLRYYEVPRVAYEDDIQYHSRWVECTPEHASGFSAVAYYYARHLIQALDTPVGIIGCNWGGTSASCWVPEEVLTGDEELKVYVDEYIQAIADKDDEVIKLEQAQYETRYAEFVRRQESGLPFDPAFVPWPPPMTPRSFLRPCGLYGTMLVKAAPYTLKGFIYYQGESDAYKPLLYDKLLSALIEQWRSDWANQMLPFLFVQLTSFGCDGHPDGEDWPLLRESQSIVAETVPNTGMAVILDCGDRLDIHPKNKQTVGERLALLALKSVYGQEVESCGPLYRKVEYVSGKAIVHFDHSGEALSSREGKLIGFQIAGEDGVYVSAHTAIRGSIVEVWSEEIANPVSVRYGWANYTEANLINSAGLPAGPFRTLRSGRNVKR